MQAGLTAVLFLGVAKAYTTSQGVNAPIAGQAAVAGVLGASALAVRTVPSANPAVRALTTGSVFAGAMYLLGNDEDLVTHAVLGTICAYAADLILPENVPEEVNEF
jgi:hypothetical protein